MLLKRMFDKCQVILHSIKKLYTQLTTVPFKLFPSTYDECILNVSNEFLQRSLGRKLKDFLKINEWYLKLRRLFLAETFSVISSDLPFKEGHPQFTTVPFKSLTDHRGRRTQCIYLKCCLKNAKLECLFCQF